MFDMLTHEEFAYQAQQTPDAVAVVYEDMQLTYREIDRRSNRVMHYLKMKQVGPEIHVGICVERSPELIIGLLGIFKAGGAYIPIDPLYPRERSSFLIEDAQISVIVTQKSLFETFATYPVQTIGVDMLEISASQEISQQILFKSVLSQNLAYIIYTSGSTGRPKGVQIDHGSLAALIDAQTQLYTIQPGERVLQFASISFDASVYEIFSTLANGATLVLAKQNELLPGPALVKLLREQVITIATLPPSVLAVLPDEELPALKTITSAGEACSAQIVSRWSPGRTFFNAYGPTEATVCATAAQCTDGTCQPPIGKAIAHKEVYVLDPDLHPVAPGESGEIYIGGEGLARGYLHQPNITAERFVPHPFTDQPGSRLYRTGDLARLLLDGSLEFLGRLDYQVKIRGFRIEPGEVEVALERHPLITQAVVLAQESPSVGVRLVAYTVINQQPGPGVDELRSFIRTWVPEYMVPALFVPMNAFPLTPNGKVDRQALPEPDQARPDLDEAFVAPRNVDEQYLADIWASVLGLESIGIHDNFFALGGHSLSAMQIIARVREIFHVDLPFSTLFATPTVVETMMAIHALQSVAQPLTVCPIQPAPRDGYLPLAFAQEQVWLIHQLAPDNRAYMASSHIKIEGDFDMSLLKRSIDELVVRHEILRTAFPTVDQLPVQIIHEPQPQDLNVIDLEPFPEPEREAEIQRLIREASSAPFDIERLPLMRWTLLKLSAQDHILILVEHHFVHDGWSSNMLLAELSEIYTALLEGRPVSLPALPIQFADFAYWQHQWIESAEAAKQRTYWVHKLASGSELLRLPIDRPRPALPDFQGSTIRIHLSAQRYEALTALSRQQGVTPFMTLFAAFLTLLYRYTGQEDLCVGSSMANRRWHEMERVAGMVVNTIVLRGNVSATTTFRELLAQVRETIIEASANQDFPFEKVVEALQPERNLSYNPIFQAMFNLHGSPLSAVIFPNTTIHLFQAYRNDSAKVDLSVTLIPRPEEQGGWTPRLGSDGLTLLWTYSTALFDDSTIRRMIGHYLTLLDAVLSDVQQCISHASLLTEGERKQLLITWNQTQVDATKSLPVHRQFERQVELTPDATALIVADQPTTYRELNRRANKLARDLQAYGVGPDVLVGVCMERSVEMVVALLGILKAGGAYVPLDPTYPQERLAYMLQDAQVPVLLTQSRIRKHVPPVDAKIIFLDANWNADNNELATNPLRTVEPDNLAYMMYTSGSTGRPRGVMNTHRGLSNYLSWIQQSYQLTGIDRVLQKTPYSFDVSVWELFWPLTTGATQVVARPGGHQDPSYLVSLIEAHKVTTLHFVPSMLQVFLTELNLEQRCRSLKRVLCGGETLSFDLQERFFSRLDTELYHRYGPTETTMCVTSWKCQRKSHNPVVPIGRPITNIQVYILSNTMQPVPIGVPGEIYIGGEGLARGYLHQPDITAERFVPDPFNQEAGRRLFKTADLARYRSDGAIEFLGRSDHQVKIRGFRIELGEIEATLWEHPNVKDAVVLVKEDTAGDKRLIAYVAPRHERTLNQSELRDFARDRLPEYMVPGSWLFLEALPLLPNGKIDRRALPDPDWQQFATEQGYVAPRTPLEMRLAKIWEGVLGRERIGILDNFFDIGGHSLRATQVIARLQQVEQIPLPLSSLFATPTIEGLANSVIRYKQKNGHGEAVAPITLHVQEQEQILPFDQSRIEQLSDEQVTTLLHEMLGQGGHLHE